MEIENNKLFIKNSNVNLDHLVDMKNITFKNQDYILKHNMNSNLKFFKDELTIKYIGKGNNTIDYAVKILYKMKFFLVCSINQADK